ncbi:MAG: amidinotransferase [Ferruginibacter sp.]|nr:amidinotransferase [Cytophagales bacterium]
MVRPVRFGFNEQTAGSNAFQNAAVAAQRRETAQESALREFDQMVNQLRAAGVDVRVVDDTPEPHTPDSIFPNNWVSFHQDGTVCLYPMQAENRRLERSRPMVEDLEKDFIIENVVDFTNYEATGKFLEGTGSMVLDRMNKVAYAGLSPRTHEAVLEDFAEKIGYQTVTFRATDGQGKEIYHTNVVMSVGDLFAVVCLNCIRDPKERRHVRSTLAKSGKEVIAITVEQLNQFAGNMLQLRNQRGESLLVMSARAYRSLTVPQIRRLEKYARLIACELDTIETNGGGSARCMVAEVFLPLR